MKTIRLLFLLQITFSSLFGQEVYPDYFSWDQRFGSQFNKDYISNAKDQFVQGPCNVFASVAALEAAIQIYFNKEVGPYEMDLSEQHIYSNCNPNAGIGVTFPGECFRQWYC